jgi:CubicO group peptidase (beta-lactamase class C family)
MKLSAIAAAAAAAAALLLSPTGLVAQPARQGSALAAAPPVPTEPLPAALASYIEAAREQWKVPGLVVAVVRTGQPAAAQGFGVRTLGRTERVDPGTVFNIASLTKAFTATAAGILVDERRLGWDDPVRRWMPASEFQDPWLSREITITDLLSHRTGLDPRNGPWILTGFDRAEVIGRLRHLKPVAPFRTRQVYNNILYTLGGEAVAAASGSSWEELVRTRLIVPLEMASTGFGVPKGPNVASPHAMIAGETRPIRHADYTNVGPAGSVHSSAADLIRWMRLNLARGQIDGRRIVSEASMNHIQHPHAIIPTTPAMRSARQVSFFAGYGLGWNVMDYRGRSAIWHSGAAEGMPAYLILLPAEGLGVLVMANSREAGALRGDIASRVLDHYLNLPTRDYAGETLARMRQASPAPAAQETPRRPPGAAAASGLPAAGYLGVYRTDLYGDVRVFEDGSKLKVQVAEGQGGELRHLNRDSYAIIWDDPYYAEIYPSTITFEFDAAGAVAGASIMLDGELAKGVPIGTPGTAS